MAQAQPGPAPELLMSFQVITDTHITGSAEHVYNKNLEQALRDIAALAPDTRGILHVGDVTNHGFPGEYGEWRRIWDEFGRGLPGPLSTTGNHDVGLGEWPARLEFFLAGTGMIGAYHDHWIDGYHFIFLGTEKNLRLFCSLSGEQLEWLDAKLAEEAAPDKPVFVFLHQPLLNTVAGSYEEQEWYGVTEDAELKAVLSKHPQAILFTGHTHWEMESPHNYFPGDGSLPAMLNAASVAYLWTDADEHKDGSQGYFVEVYADRVLIKGRDFMRGEWIKTARYEVACGARRAPSAGSAES